MLIYCLLGAIFDPFNFLLQIYIGIGFCCNHETLDYFYVLLFLKLKKMTSGLLKNLEENRFVLNLENY